MKPLAFLLWALTGLTTAFSADLPLIAAESIMGRIDQYPPAVQAKARAAVAMRSEMFRSALKIGVKISFGTDAGVYPQGQNAKEFALVTGLS